ncbi:MAG: peptidoglycan DD-metalloendopeptidase family protein [Thermoleophilaceae bacterium]
MRRRFWVSITLGLSAYLLLPLPGLSAPLSERIGRAQDKVESKKYKEHVLSKTIAGQNVQIRGLQGEIRGLQDRQNRIQGSLDDKRAELIDVRDKLEVAKKRLAELKEDLGVAEGALGARLVEIYKADEPDALTVVLHADGFGDLLERAEFLDRVSDQDQRIVTRVRELKAAAKKQAKELGVLERRVEEAADAILARRNEVAAVRGRIVESRDELQGARNDRRETLSHVRSSRVRLEGDLRAMEAEQERVRNALLEAQNGGGGRGGGGGAGPVRRGSGRLIWPVNGPVVSPFGQRWGRLHAGIDIAVPSGTPIRAADSGSVVLAGWTGGYGNYVCIQHTSNLSTCYAHLSSYGTSRGASVRQGQTIGSVGCTGHCFGDHLHFETRVNGSPVSPMGYL